MMNKGLESLIKPGLGLSVTEISQYDNDPWNGRLLVWDVPRQGEEYILGVDSAEGIKRDRSVCQVILKGNLTHASEQVAEFACDSLDPIDFAAVVATIGKFYSDPDGTEAFCTIETNNPAGAAILNTLRTKLDYSNLFIRKDYEKRENLFTTKLGWHTTRHNRGLIIARGLHALQYGDLILHSPYLLDEMADFESNHDMAVAKVKASKGHDDRIMALLVGYFGGFDDSWLAGDDIDEQRRLRQQASTIQEEMAVKTEEVHTGKVRPDYINQAVSWTKAQELAEDGWWDQ